MASGPIGWYRWSADVRPPLKRRMTEYSVLLKRTGELFSGNISEGSGQGYENGDRLYRIARGTVLDFV